MDFLPFLAAVASPTSGVLASLGSQRQRYIKRPSVSLQVTMYIIRRWCCKNWVYPRHLTWYDKVGASQQLVRFLTHLLMEVTFSK